MGEGVIHQRGMRSHLRRPAAAPNLAVGWARSLSAPPPWALLAPGNAPVALPISGFAPLRSGRVKPSQTWSNHFSCEPAPAGEAAGGLLQQLTPSGRRLAPAALALPREPMVNGRVHHS